MRLRVASSPQALGRERGKIHPSCLIDETGHLRLGIKGCDGGRKWPGRSNERRVIDGAESRHPFSGVSGCWHLIRLGGETTELLRGDFKLASLAGLPVARGGRLAGAEVDEGGCASDPRRQDPRRKTENLT